MSSVLDQLNASDGGILNNGLFTKFIPSLSYLNNQNGSPLCFNKGTLILCLHNNADKWIPIEELTIGTFVKTYLHGYKRISYIGTGVMKNNINEPLECMYKMPKDSTMQNDLIVTGGHSILVDNIDNQTEYEQNMLYFNGINYKIDDKYLILSCASNKFVKLEDENEYTYYHFVLENDGNKSMRYGVWAEGVLTETPSEEYFIKHLMYKP